MPPAPPAADPSDEQLFRRYVQSEDRLAFGVLFRRYADRVLHVFRRSGLAESIAEELVQQTFLHVHRARNDFRLDGRFRPWLFAIAMNVRREHFRWRGRRPEDAVEDMTGFEPSVPPSVSTAPERLLRRALDELSDDQREVIVLHWFEDLPFDEIGQIVGASTSAVKVRAHRGYERLRKSLGVSA